MAQTQAQDARAALTAAGTLPDAELDIGTIALHLARIDAPEADWRAAAAHLSDLAREAVQAATDDPDADAGDLDRRRAIFARVLRDAGYAGDLDTYDDLANANLIRVIERRRGLPVALGVLWLHLADAVGWSAHGVDFPGHFLLALEGARGQAVVDVFAGGDHGLQAPELRALVKRVEGDKAELRPGLLQPMSRRGVLLRLQNNIKLRRLRGNDLAGALACTQDMLLLAPDHAALWREAGLMNQRLDQIAAALNCLERSLELEPEGPAAFRTRAVLEELRHRLN